MERIGTYLQTIQNRFRQPYVKELELETNRFCLNLSPGANDKLFETKDEKLRIYHIGSETKFSLGHFQNSVPTGRESIFIEFQVEGEMYHLVGGFELASNEFKLVKLEKYNPKGYSKIGLDKKVIQQATEMMRSFSEAENSSS